MIELMILGSEYHCCKLHTQNTQSRSTSVYYPLCYTDGRTESQIDHILINGKWRRSLQDVKTRRLADAGSDQNLLIGKLALKLRKAKTGEEERVF